MLDCLIYLAFLSISVATEDGKKLITPSTLSDFITARQSRNLTLNGQKDLQPIIGRYFRKPLVNLLQSVHPSVLNFRNLFFRNFDGIVLKGDSNSLAKFPDIVIKDCSFIEANQHPIHIHGPVQRDAFIDTLFGYGNIDE